MTARVEAPPELAQLRKSGRMIIVLMGVSGAGKTAVGEALAARLGWFFEDADALHPPASVAKMRRGIPLTEDDRRPWLVAVNRALCAWITDGRDLVLACSALRRPHRDVLRAGLPDDRTVRFVYLRGEHDEIERRLRTRKGHFMPPSLLASQFDALEDPVRRRRSPSTSIRRCPPSWTPSFGDSGCDGGRFGRSVAWSGDQLQSNGGRGRVGRSFPACSGAFKTDMPAAPAAASAPATRLADADGRAPPLRTPPSRGERPIAVAPRTTARRGYHSRLTPYFGKTGSEVTTVSPSSRA